MRLVMRRGVVNVILVIGICLLALWLLGFASSYMMGGFLYVALFVGFILVFFSLVTRARYGRRR